MLSMAPVLHHVMISGPPKKLVKNSLMLHNSVLHSSLSSKRYNDRMIKVVTSYLYLYLSVYVFCSCLLIGFG